MSLVLASTFNRDSQPIPIEHIGKTTRQLTKQNKRPRLGKRNTWPKMNSSYTHTYTHADSSYLGSIAQACDSTYNSEESEAESSDEESYLTANEDETLPEEARDNTLKYILQAREVAKRSDDPHTKVCILYCYEQYLKKESPIKVGAVVVNKKGTVIGEGHNYLPREGLPWDRKAKREEDTKYPYGEKTCFNITLANVYMYVYYCSHSCSSNCHSKCL